MKNIAIITATRAEYGLLKPLINELRTYESDDFTVSLIVIGTHLSNEYGNTIDEIIKDNIRIDYKIATKIDSANQYDISYNQADVLCKMTDLFSTTKFDGIVILGDRYEMLSVAIAASNALIPIFHLCGGDTTEGALDEWIRHSITKMSYLHFVTNKHSFNRVMQLGESPDRIYNFGSTSIDNIKSLPLYSKEEALKSIGIDNCNYALCTYHPVTMENADIKSQIQYLINAIKSYPDLQFIVTKSNADSGGGYINELWDYYGQSIDNIHVFTSLGIFKYLSLMKHCEFVIGNSSSGIIETPSFHVPTINIGDRQKGRLRTKSIIDCDEDTESITYAIDKALNPDFVNMIKSSICEYGEGDSGKKIAEVIYSTTINDNINLKKTFYNIKELQ